MVGRWQQLVILGSPAKVRATKYPLQKWTFSTEYFPSQGSEIELEQEMDSN
jgi:hypothetical protein